MNWFKKLFAKKVVKPLSEYNHDEMVEYVITHLSVKDKIWLQRSPRNRLIQFHHNIGRWIRNTFELWSRPFTPEIVDGVDISKDHPDAISMRVIEDVYNKLNDTLL